MSRSRISRRQFVRLSTSMATAAWVAPAGDLLAGPGAASDRLNVAIVGAGGRGQSLIEALAGRVHLTAFAEVDETYAARTFQAYPRVPRYTDYRKMYDELNRKIDAVVVATPDHHHY